MTEMGARPAPPQSPFGQNPVLAVAVVAIWTTLSIVYYNAIHAPSELNVLVNIGALALAAAVLALLPSRQLMLKVFVTSFALSVCLASLQISTGQRDFTEPFLAFLWVHACILALAIFVGSLIPPDSAAVDRPALFVNLAVYAFIGIGLYVAVSQGLRLSDFLDGIKRPGGDYKIPLVSGVQGILAVFLLCSFSMLSRTNKIIFITAALAFALFDVKRGEIIRIALFLMFWASLVSPKRTLTIIGWGGVVSLVMFVLGGELRQWLYDDEFSISAMIRSRVEITAIDWIYPYFGITPSVLQEYFVSDTAPAGYFRVLLGNLLDIESPEISNISIYGANAGTVFSVFAGQERVWPSWDFLGFGMIVAGMVACATRLGTASLLAFVMVQIFCFVFGNQLILPAYLLGFAASVLYQTLPSHLATRWLRIK